MVLTALMAGTGPLADPDAKTYYDGMFLFFKDHPSKHCSRLMSWQVFGDSLHEDTTKDASASDGDLDIAYSLLLAHFQWGSDGAISYLDEAKDMLQNGIGIADVGRQTKRILLGDWDEQFDYQSRPSDWMADHFHSFYAATLFSLYNDVADEIYNLYKKFRKLYSPQTGLISDFIVNKEPEPAPPEFLEWKWDGDYYNNACRVPFRIANDYAHHTTPAAKDICNVILNWLKSETQQDPENISFGYTLDGNLIYESFSTMYASPFIAACIVDAAHQEYLNKGWTAIKDSRSNYYNDTINLLCMLLISGNWWRPGDQIIAIADDLIKTIAGPGTLKTYYNRAAGKISISYTLPHRSRVSLGIYSSNGTFVQEIAGKGRQNSGSHTVTAKTNIPSGVYFIRCSIDGAVYSTVFNLVK